MDYFSKNCLNIPLLCKGVRLIESLLKKCGHTTGRFFLGKLALAVYSSLHVETSPTHQSMNFSSFSFIWKFEHEFEKFHITCGPKG